MKVLLLLMREHVKSEKARAFEEGVALFNNGEYDLASKSLNHL